MKAYNDPFPHFDTLAEAVYKYVPVEGDSLDYLADVLCYGKLGADALSSDAATTAHLCAQIQGVSAKRDIAVDGNLRQGLRSRLEPVLGSNKTTLDKREFMVDWTTIKDLAYGWPTTGNALDFAGSGTLRPEFFNWFRYQTTQIEMEGKYLITAFNYTMSSPAARVGPLTIHRFFPAVFLLGPNPQQLAPFLQFSPRSRYLVVHVHFNADGLIDGHLAIDQINIRHAETIRARDANPIAGRFQAGSSDASGQECFRCNRWDTGLDPWNLPTATNVQMDLITRLVQTMRQWGQSGRLFDQRSPDPSTYQRQESGPLTGAIVRDEAGTPLNQFTGSRFSRGNGGLAFAPDGSLYDPFTRNGGDIVNTPGFYVQSNGQPLP